MLAGTTAPRQIAQLHLGALSQRCGAEGLPQRDTQVPRTVGIEFSHDVVRQDRFETRTPRVAQQFLHEQPSRKPCPLFWRG